MAIPSSPTSLQGIGGRNEGGTAGRTATMHRQRLVTTDQRVITLDDTIGAVSRYGTRYEVASLCGRFVVDHHE
jgi:hypothetical protein